MAGADGSHEQPFIADKLPAPQNQVHHRNTCKSVGPSWRGWAYHAAARAAAPGSYLFGKMEKPRALSAGSVAGRRGAAKAAGWLSPAQPPLYTSCCPVGRSSDGWGALYQPIKRTDMQPGTATAKVAWLRHQPFLWTRRCQRHSSCLPLWPCFGHTALLPSMKTSAESAPQTRTSGGGCTRKVFQQREQCGGLRHDQATKSKQMLSPVDKKQPQAAAGSWHQGLGLILAWGINW